MQIDTLLRLLDIFVSLQDLCIAFLLVSSRAHYDLELRLIKRHQAEVETREEATEAEEDPEHHHAGPDG